GGAAGGNDVPRQVQQVVDHEQRDHHTTPPHREGGVTALVAPPRLRGHVPRAAAAGGGTARAAPQCHGAVDVDDDRHQQDDAHDPQGTGVGQDGLAHGAQVVGVGVECLLAGEDLEVPVHVRYQEQHDEKPTDGHRNLQDD